jgi:hypothetical protein
MSFNNNNRAGQIFAETQQKNLAIHQKNAIENILINAGHVKEKCGQNEDYLASFGTLFDTSIERLKELKQKKNIEPSREAQLLINILITPLKKFEEELDNEERKKMNPENYNKGYVSSGYESGNESNEITHHLGGNPKNKSRRNKSKRNSKKTRKH